MQIPEDIQNQLKETAKLEEEKRKQIQVVSNRKDQICQIYINAKCDGCPYFYECRGY